MWKYLKGSEEDFKGAPDWALYKLLWVASGENIFAEDRLKGSRRTGFNDPQLTGEITHPSSYLITAQREKVAEWDGVGIPTVGSKVEYSYMMGEWRKATVEYVKASVGILFTQDDGYSLFVEDATSRALRYRKPLRTKEDKFIEEVTHNFKWNPSDPDIKSILTCTYKAIVQDKVSGVKLVD